MTNKANKLDYERTLAKMETLSEEEGGEEEGVLRMEEWDNLRPKNWEFDDGVKGSDGFWEGGLVGVRARSKVGREWLERVRELALAIDEESGDNEKQNSNKVCLL